MTWGLTFHHFGLAVRDETAAIKMLTGLGYEVGSRIYDSEQNVHLRMCSSPTMPDIELIAEGNGPGPLESILKRSTEMLYHSCYETEDLENSVERIKEEGLRVMLVSPPKKAILFGGRHVSFHYIPGFGLIELLQPGAVDKKCITRSS